MKANSKIIIVLTAVLFCLLPNTGLSHQGWVHEQMVMDAYTLLKSQTHVDQISPFFDGFFTYALQVPKHPTVCSTTEAAYDADYHELLFNNYGWVGEQISATHFWDADAADPYQHNSLEWLPGTYNNAFDEAEQLWNGGHVVYMPGPWSLAGYVPESNALRDQGMSIYDTYLTMIVQYESLPGMFKNERYTFLGVVTNAGTEVRFTKTYTIDNHSSLYYMFSANILGRVAHLLGDMTEPMHVKVRSHPCPITRGSRYELYMGEGIVPVSRRYFPPRIGTLLAP